MPGDDVTASAPQSATPPPVGIVGKLPGHGDFVRRGQPAAVLARVDAWLEEQLGAAVGTDLALEQAVDALDGWCLAIAEAGGGVVLLSLVASTDGVGRCFPVVATCACASVDPAEADRWCAAAAAALADVRDRGGSADAAIAAVASIARPEDAGARPVARCWHANGRIVAVCAPDGGLPTGSAFRAMLARPTG